MEYKLIKDNTSEIATEEERERFETNLKRLQASRFEFPIPLNEFFDLCMYNLLIEQKLIDVLHGLILDMKMNGKTTKSMLKMQESIVRKQMVSNNDIKGALQRELSELGYKFDVEEKTKNLIKALRTIRNNRRGRRKEIDQAVQSKTAILEEINDIVSGQEPKM